MWGEENRNYLSSIHPLLPIYPLVQRTAGELDWPNKDTRKKGKKKNPINLWLDTVYPADLQLGIPGPPSSQGPSGLELALKWFTTGSIQM